MRAFGAMPTEGSPLPWRERDRVRARLFAARSQAGFTLLEIMVVMVLIAISVTFVVLNLDRDTDGVAELEARRFASLVEQARDESVLSGRPYAVHVDPAARSYEFLQHGEQWSPVDNDDVFRPRHFPEDLAVSFKILDGPESGGLLVIEGLGEITPFMLTVQGDSRRYRVSVDDGQNVIVESEANES